MRELRIHHFFDIIRDYGAGNTLKPHVYGHSYHLIGNEIYNNDLAELKLIVNNDDICENCSRLDGDHCVDTIDHRTDFSSKEKFNDWIDSRIMAAMGYSDGQLVSVKDIILNADKYLDNIFEIYEGNDVEHTEMRKKNVRKGIERKIREINIIG